MKKIIIGVVVLLVLVGGYCFITRDNGEVDGVVVITNFLECTEAGHPVMESYPRQCSDGEQTFVEEVEIVEEEPVVVDIPEAAGDTSVRCLDEERDMMCTQQYEPVCGLVRVECVTTPCDPVPETFPNGCTACSNERVSSYEEGECVGA